MHVKIASGCVKGIAHEAYHLPCQDYVYTLRHQDKAVIALSDGAGSRKLSQIGAQIACQEVCQLCMNEFDMLFEMDEKKVSQTIVESIQLKMVERGYQLDSISCTLLFYAIKQDQFLMGHIGDGMVFEVMQGTTTIRSFPENGEQENQTYFITEQEASQHLRVQKGILKDQTCIILTSDGGMESLFEKKNKQPAIALERMTQWLVLEKEEEVSAALEENIKDIFMQHSKDDISLVMLLWMNLDMEELVEERIDENFEEQEEISLDESFDTYVEEDTDMKVEEEQESSYRKKTLFQILKQRSKD